MQPVYELGGRFAVGEKFYASLLSVSSFLAPDHTLKTPSNGDSVPSQELDDVIVKVTPIAAAISWSAINQSVCNVAPLVSWQV